MFNPPNLLLMIVSQGKCTPPFPALVLHNQEGWVSNWMAHGGIRIDHRWDTHVQYLRTWSFSNLTIKMIIKVHYPTTNVVEIIWTQYFFLVALASWMILSTWCLHIHQPGNAKIFYILMLDCQCKPGLGLSDKRSGSKIYAWDHPTVPDNGIASCLDESNALLFWTIQLINLCYIHARTWPCRSCLTFSAIIQNKQSPHPTEHV